MRLGKRYERALAMALRFHRDQKRKGTSIPYAAHLLSTSALVLQFGGSEVQAIAALLHDAAEDAGGHAALERIRSALGARVARMVEGCTDTFERRKPAWLERKRRYIRSIPEKSPETLLVVACDKLDNARAIVADLRRHGPGTLARFSGGADTPWYYRAICEALVAAGKGTPVEQVARELRLVVREMKRLAGHASGDRR